MFTHEFLQISLFFNWKGLFLWHHIFFFRTQHCEVSHFSRPICVPTFVQIFGEHKFWIGYLGAAECFLLKSNDVSCMVFFLFSCQHFKDFNAIYYLRFKGYIALNVLYFLNRSQYFLVFLDDRFKVLYYNLVE